MAVRHLLEESALGTEERGFNIGAREDEERPKGDESHEHTSVNSEAKRVAQRLALFDSVQGGVADEAAGSANFVHDRVASINAGGAMDAFHLGAVANINASGTNGRALAAINAVATVTEIPQLNKGGSTNRAQPRWGWVSPLFRPRVAHSSQPWAGGRHPFGMSGNG